MSYSIENFELYHSLCDISHLYSIVAKSTSRLTLFTAVPRASNLSPPHQRVITIVPDIKSFVPMANRARSGTRNPR